MEAANAKLVQQIDNLTVERAAQPAKSEDGKLVFGHKLTSVIRWMGKEGWKFDEARKAMDGLEIAVADATIRCQLTAGKNGKRGNPAALSPAQAKTFTKFLNQGKKNDAKTTKSKS